MSFAETDLLDDLGNAEAIHSAAIFCSADRGLAHVGLGPVSTRGISSCLQPSRGSPCAALADADVQGSVHEFKGELLGRRHAARPKRVVHSRVCYPHPVFFFALKFTSLHVQLITSVACSP